MIEVGEQWVAETIQRVETNLGTGNRKKLMDGQETPFPLSSAVSRILTDYRDRVNQALRKNMRDPNRFTHRVYQAMEYSLFAGGKRLRPILCLLACRLVNGRSIQSLPAACALEFIHTYSLIHDDLPALDNDDFRRGRPSCHKKFGEATAILAGDALLTEAFSLLSSPGQMSKVPPGTRLGIIREISLAAGLAGMIGGQEADLEGEKKTVSLAYLQDLHRKKTGALITASLVCGGLIGGADQETLQALRIFGPRIGLAFQIRDDLLNVEGQFRDTGKATGTDARRNKATYPAKVGVGASRETARDLVKQAVEILRPWGRRARPLAEIGYYMISRNR
jgi:geranylgeranyl diphosphate synthase, type II